jgi:cytochrome c biogenesis factor
MKTPIRVAADIQNICALVGAGPARCSYGRPGNSLGLPWLAGRLRKTRPGLRNEPDGGYDSAHNSAFLAGLLFADNPFKPAAAGGEGFGLSPSLQSLGMVFHPPLVMAAYSFLFAAFAERLGLAAGYAAGPDGSPRSASRTALLGWLLLTAGIAGGGIWAYTELGWGGYWSWDPIETSAMSVWLLLSAYLHAGGKEGERGRLSLVLISATVFAYCPAPS